MLELKQLDQPYEVRKCDISGEFIVYGDWYYEDDTDHKVIKATVYKKLQKEARDKKFDYTLLNRAKSEKEYRDAVKKAEKDFLLATILDRPALDNGIAKNNGLE